MTHTLVPIRSIAVAIHILLWPALALAQSTATAQAPTRVRGSIEALSGSEMTVKTRDGDTMKIALAPNLAVGTVRRATLADIKPGDFVGSAAVKGRDGKLHALEVHIFPEAMRGTGEGQRPWDSGPDSSMTNATVGEVCRPDRRQCAQTHIQGRNRRDRGRPEYADRHARARRRFDAGARPGGDAVRRARRLGRAHRRARHRGKRRRQTANVA